MRRSSWRNGAARSVAVGCAAWLTLQSCRWSEEPFVLTDAPADIAALNVLVVLLDDVGVDKISGYGEHPLAPPTPTIDALAEQGVRFTNAWAFPVCAPSRAALITGRYPRAVSIDNNIQPHELGVELARDVPTLPELVGRAEPPYTSSGIGKWHLEARSEQSVSGPKARGFDHYAGNLGNLAPGESYYDYAWEDDDGVVTQRTQYLTSAEIDLAVEQVRTLPEPWLLYVALHAPHAPWTLPPAGLFTDPGDLEGDADLYDAMLEAADTELARLLDEVDLSRTVVFVLGDNGTPDQAVRPPWIKAEAKNTVYEGGVNVPFVVAGGPVTAGAVRDDLVDVQDIYPTIAEMAGIQPYHGGPYPEGESLWPILRGGAAGARMLYVERILGFRPDGICAATRDARYKVIRCGEDDVTFHDLRGRSDDGPDLLEGGPLDTEQQAAFEALLEELERIDAELDQSTAGCNR